MKKLFGIPLLLFLLSVISAVAQITGGSVNVVGAVTAGHCTSFAGPSTIQDAGGICGGTGSAPGAPVGSIQWNSAGTFTGTAHWSTNGTSLTTDASGILNLATSPVLTGLTFPSAAGAAPTTDGIAAFNTTNHLPVFGSNGATLTWPSTLASVSHNFITSFTNTTGIFTQAQPAFTDISGTAQVAQGGTGATTLTGPLKGNGASAFTSAAAADIVGLFSVCSGTQYLGADGSCHTASGGGLADPGSNGVVKRTALNTTAVATSTDIIGLFTACSGTQYLGADGACHTASGSGTVTSSGPPTANQGSYFTSGTNIAGITGTIGQQYTFQNSAPPIAQTKATIDIRDDPTVPPSASADFCAAMHNVIVTAVANNSEVNMENPGAFATGGKVFCNSNPYAGIVNIPTIRQGTYTIVISVPWVTTITSMGYYGDVPQTVSGSVIQACNAASGTCGPGNFPIFPGSGANTLRVAATGPLPAPNFYSTGTITTTGTTAVTGSGTAWTAGMVDSTICISTTSKCTKAGAFGIVKSVNSATSITLEAATLGTVTGVNYIIIPALVTPMIWDGGLATSASDGTQGDCFGHRWEHITLDTNGISGATTYYTSNCQERTNLVDVRQTHQATTASQNTTSTPFTLTSVNATGVYQGTITGCAANACANQLFTITGFTNGANNITAVSSASTATSLTLNFIAPTVIETHAGTATEQTPFACSIFDRSFQYAATAGATHYHFTDGQCGSAAQTTGTLSYGHIIEDSLSDGAGGYITAASPGGGQTDGPNGMFDMGTVVGKSGNQLTAAVWVDGVQSISIQGGHCEWDTTCIEVGANSVTAGVHISDIHASNMSGAGFKVVWFHSNTLSSSAQNIESQVGNKLLEDDAANGQTISGVGCANAGGINTTCLIPIYVQPTSAASTFGPVNVFGQITNPFTLTVDATDMALFSDTATPSTNGTTTNGLANQALIAIQGGTASTATPLEVVQGSVTGTTAFPAMQVETTWNNAGLTGLGYLFNVTDTASNAASLIFDWRKANVSQLKLDKSGNLTALTSLNTGGSNGGILGTEGTCANAAAATSVDILCPNSTAHWFEISGNNSTLEPVAGINGAVTTGHAAKFSSANEVADAGYSATAIPLADLATEAANTTVANVTSGTASPTAVAIPVGIQNYVSGTGYNQATAHQLSTALVCAAASGSGTAYTCSTSPTFTPADGDVILFQADVANTGSATLNVNATSAATIKKQGGGTNLVANDLIIGQDSLLEFDGTNWQMQGQTGNASGSGTVTSVATTSPITGGTFTTTGTVGCATCVTSAASLTNNGLVVGSGGAQGTATSTITVSGGIFTNYDGQTTAGLGHPTIIGTLSDVTGQSTSQTSVNLIASTAQAGSYMIRYYLDQNAVCATPGPGQVLLTFSWTDATHAHTVATVALPFLAALSTTGGYLQGTVPLFSATASAISYTSTVTACTTGTATYDVHVSVEETK